MSIPTEERFPSADISIARLCAITYSSKGPGLVRIIRDQDPMDYNVQIYDLLAMLHERDKK